MQPRDGVFQNHLLLGRILIILKPFTMEISRPPSGQPTPPHARCVFQGVIFNVYQWEQVDYAGNIKIFETLKRSDTAIIIPVTQEGSIIYSKQEQLGKAPFMSLIGGRVDEGEGGWEAAKRELLEETGYEAKEWALLEAAHPMTKIDWCIYTFIARGCRKVGERNLDGGEKIELRFATFEEFAHLITHEDFREDGLRIRFLEAMLDSKKMQELRTLIVGEG